MQEIQMTKLRGFEIIDSNSKKYTPAEFLKYLKDKNLNLIEGG